MTTQAVGDRIIGVIGPGRFGSALALSLDQLGCEVQIRTKNHPLSLTSWLEPCHILCLTVRDSQIEELVSQLADSSLSGKTVLLHSGATPLSVLKPLKDRGAVVGKFHPLQAFTEVGGSIPPGTPFAAEGPIAELVEPWVRAWSGTLHWLEGDQWRIYHLAAVTAANFLPLFIREGAALLEEDMASDQQAALDWLAPLVRHSVEGALNAAVSQPFSGPAIRDDLITIQQHLQLLEETRPDLAAIYRICTERIRNRK